MSPSSDGVVHGVAGRAGRVDVLLADVIPDLSRSRAAALVREGRVSVAGAVVTRASHAVRAGDTLTVDLPPPVPAEAVAQALPIDVVYEDDAVVVVDKAPGMVVHPGAGHADGTLVNALLHAVGDLSGIGGVARPGIVHRLDRGTSGLLVVAKHDVAHRALAAQFAAHTAGRTYLAVTFAAPRGGAAGTIRSRLARHPTDRLRFASTTDTEAGKEAVTHWERLAVGRDGVSLVACRLETGRTHQIRVHLSEHGAPLLGDHLYARRRSVPTWAVPLLPDERPMLHAWQLRFTHPVDGRPCAYSAPAPSDFVALLDASGLPDPTRA